MIAVRSFLLMTGAALLLAGCAGSGSAPRGAAAAPTSAGQRPATNLHRQPVETGVLIGRDRRALVASLGEPRLDMAEGPATKLQFSGSRCVLDAYLYPPRTGAEPVVTHVDTRDLNGADVDANACIAMLQRRQ